MSNTPTTDTTDTTSTDISRFLAGGTVTGAIVSGIFLLYKICKGRRLKSSCCGSQMDIGSDMPVVIIQANDTTPKASAKSSPIIRKSVEREKDRIDIEEFKLSD